MRWEKVDFQRNVIYVPNSKTGKDYPVPMNNAVRNIMLGLRREDRKSEYVFINPKTGKPYHDLKKAFATACRLAGITGLRWHDLRHTFGTRLAESGCSEVTIAELMGHSDPETTRRYTHATDRAKQAAVEAVSLSGRNPCPIYAPNEIQPPKLAAVFR
jgi:integrase